MAKLDLVVIGERQAARLISGGSCARRDFLIEILLFGVEAVEREVRPRHGAGGGEAGHQQHGDQRLADAVDFEHAAFYAPTTRTPGDPGERFHVEAHIKPVFAVGT